MGPVVPKKFIPGSVGLVGADRMKSTWIWECPAATESAGAIDNAAYPAQTKPLGSMS